MSAEHIVNFVRIDDRAACAGQPTREQLVELAAEDYELVVNLAPEGLSTTVAEERDLLGGLGIEYHQIPVPWAAPRHEHLAAFADRMEQAAGRRTLIHCQANLRVTAFYSLYAMEHLGWDAERARSLRDSVWATRPGFTMDETWRSFIAEESSRIEERC